MHVLSVNVSQPKTVTLDGKTYDTGIYKTPVEGRVMLRQLGFDGDVQVDRKNHGGIDKAAYLYTAEAYDYWKRKLQLDNLTYGQFGENLTVAGLTEQDLHMNDVFRIGEAIVRVCAPRIPCYKLENKMDIPGFIKSFRESGRPGVYVHVLEEGTIAADDDIEQIEAGKGQVPIYELVELFYTRTPDKDMLRRVLELEHLNPYLAERYLAKLES